MPRLLGLQGDAEGRVGCSECVKRWTGRTDVRYLFEMSDGSVEQYELRMRDGKYERRENAPTVPLWEAFPNEGDVICASCRMNDGAHRTFSLATRMET